MIQSRRRILPRPGHCGGDFSVKTSGFQLAIGFICVIMYNNHA
jgi:hypothetical protein